MPNSTPNFGIPYPVGTDPAYIHTDMANIAVETDTQLKDYIDTLVGQQLVGNIVRVTTPEYTAVNRDFLLCDSTNAITITLTAPASESDFIRIVNFGTANVTATSSETMAGYTTIAPNKGMMAIFSDNQWWCLPLSSSPAESGTGWTRPIDWLSLPELIEGEEVVYAIARIYENLSNTFTFIISGDYTIDWGDGSVVDYIAGEEATHTYNWSSISSTTETTKGFRQAIIEIRPQIGFNLTSYDAASANSQNGGKFAEVKMTGPFLELIDNICYMSFMDTISLIIQHPNLITWLELSDDNAMSFIENVYADLPMVQDIGWTFSYSNIKNAVLNTSPNLTSIRGLVADSNIMDSSIIITDTSGVTDMSNVFSDTIMSDDNIPTLDMSSVTNSYSMFNWSLITTLPSWLNTSNVTTAQYMFSGCYNLESIPALDMSNVGSAQDLCRNCGRLKSSGIYGIVASHSYYYCSLDGDALNNIFTNLGTVPAPAQVISVYPDSPTSGNLIFQLDSPLNIGSSYYNYLTFAGFSDANWNGSKYVYYNYGGDPTKIFAYGGYFAYYYPSQTTIPSTLGTVASGGSITITGNPGISDVSYDPSIATNKGWTVVE